MQGLGQAGPDQLRRLLGAVADIGGALDLEVVLERIIQTAADLVGATYGALGVLDPSGTHLTDFVTVGLTAEQREQIGELPNGHGILGLLIVDPQPIRLPDLTQHPDSFGFPPGHPPMTSFLGVPLFIRGGVFGNLYLTDKVGGAAFTKEDEDLAMGLATAAAVAIENARLHARLREHDLAKDRERIARDLHDTVIQRLFATGLSLQAAVADIDLPDTRSRVEGAIDQLDITVREIRTSIFELQSHDDLAGGPRRSVLAVGDDLAETLGTRPAFRFDGPVDTLVDADTLGHLLAVVREGLSNVAQHAPGSETTVTVIVHHGWLEVHVDDNGPGPGPRRAGGQGLANLASRAEELGGESSFGPLASGGSQLRWRVPLPPTT